MPITDSPRASVQSMALALPSVRKECYVDSGTAFFEKFPSNVCMIGDDGRQGGVIGLSWVVRCRQTFVRRGDMLTAELEAALVGSESSTLLY